MSARQEKLGLHLESNTSQPPLPINWIEQDSQDQVKKTTFEDFFRPTHHVDLLQLPISGTDITFKDLPDLLENASERYKSKNKAESNSNKNFRTSISNNYRLIPYLLSLVDLDQDLDIEPFEYAKAFESNPKTDYQHQGIALHNAYQLFQVAFGVIKQNRPLKMILPSATREVRELFQETLNLTGREFWGMVSYQEGMEYLDSLWKTHLDLLDKNNQLTDSHLWSKNNADFESTLFKLSHFLWNTYTGNEFLVPESHLGYRKRLENELLVYDPVLQQTTYIRQDCTWFDFDTKQRLNHKKKWITEITYDLGMSDLKTSSQFASDTPNTHPFANVAFGFNTILALWADYLMLEKMRTQNDPCLTIDKHPPIIYTPNTFSPPAKRHRLRARYLHLESKSGHLTPYQIEARRPEFEWFEQMQNALADIRKSLPKAQINALQNGFVQHRMDGF